MRRAFEDPLAFLLRHAAQNSEHFALAVFFLELLQAMKNFLLGFVADAAGVVEHQVGFAPAFHLRVTLGNQRADHLFGIVRVHLASEGFDVESLHA